MSGSTPAASIASRIGGQWTGSVTVAANHGDQQSVVLPLSVTSSFPSCFADARFKLAVVAKSVPA